MMDRYFRRKRGVRISQTLSRPSLALNSGFGILNHQEITLVNQKSGIAQRLMTRQACTRYLYRNAHAQPRTTGIVLSSMLRVSNRLRVYTSTFALKLFKL
jgi:hypothetical protein